MEAIVYKEFQMVKAIPGVSIGAACGLVASRLGHVGIKADDVLVMVAADMFDCLYSGTDMSAKDTIGLAAETYGVDAAKLSAYVSDNFGVIVQ